MTRILKMKVLQVGPWTSPVNGWPPVLVKFPKNPVQASIYIHNVN